MNCVAILLDGGPSAWIFEQQLELCVYVPILVAFLSWLLIRWRARAALAAFILASLGGIVVLGPYFGLFGYAPGYEPSLPYEVAPWFAIAWPVVFIIAVYRREKNRPNKSPETSALARE